jgi:hypothetical protein
VKWWKNNKQSSSSSSRTTVSAPAFFNIIPSLEGHRLRVGTAQSRIELCSIKTTTTTYYYQGERTSCAATAWFVAVTGRAFRSDSSLRVSQFVAVTGGAFRSDFSLRFT